MHRMVAASLLVNIAVLVPVSIGMLLNADWAVQSYGGETPARQILLSIYLAILCASIGLLLRREEHGAITLLLVQIAYKVATPFAVGTALHPVVMSNIAIAALHTATVAVVLQRRAK